MTAGVKEIDSGRNIMVKALFVATLAILFSGSLARADYTQRLSLGAGVVTMSNPSQTSVELGAEYG